MSEDDAEALVIGYITTPSREAASSIAQVVVSERLAACANLLPGVTSVYHWNGSIQTDEECVLVLKTRRSLASRLSARVVSLHSYECPCVVFLQVVDGNPSYLEWLRGETASRDQRD